MEFLNPEKILKQLDLHEEMTCADFGCGSGEFTIPLAKRVKRGRVWGFDILKDPLSALEGMAAMQRLNNIKTLVCDLERPLSTKLSANSLDYVFILNILFQVKDKKALLSEAQRILRPGGLLLVVDWNKNQTVNKGEMMTSDDEVRRLAQQVGLKAIKEIDAGEMHFGLLIAKP